MNFRFLFLLASLALVVSQSGVFAAATTATPSPAAAPAPPPGGASAAKAPAAPAPKPPVTLLDKYLNELGDTVQLSADEKKEIKDYYLADGAQLQKILNDTSLSPLQQAQQVSDLRDARNAKIEELLQGGDRMHEFLQVEARYRVALTESAAEGGLVPAPAE